MHFGQTPPAPQPCRRTGTAHRRPSVPPRSAGKEHYLFQKRLSSCSVLLSNLFSFCSISAVYSHKSSLVCCCNLITFTDGTGDSAVVTPVDKFPFPCQDQLVFLFPAGFTDPDLLGGFTRYLVFEFNHFFQKNRLLKDFPMPALGRADPAILPSSRNFTICAFHSQNRPATSSAKSSGIFFKAS